MRDPFAIPTSFENNSGAAGVYMIGLIVLAIGFAALAVDIGYLYVSRNELQNAADAAALAATRQLGVIYEGVPLAQQWNYVCDTDCQDLINAAAINTAASNSAASASIVVQAADIVIGRWNANTKILDTSNGMLRPDAVRVTAKRNEDPNTGGKIATFFAGILGLSSASVSTVATAALTGSSAESYIDLELPIGISEAWTYECDSDIHFYPTNDSCAAWTDFFTKNGTYDPDDNSNSDSTVRKLVEDIRTGAFPYTGMPEKVMIDNILPFTGGNLSKPTFDEMESLFNSKKECCDENGKDYWDTTVVVYKNPADLPGPPPNCNNANGELEIVGFAQIRVTEVINASGKFLQGKLKCGFDSERGGGGPGFGTLGSIPNLVQ